MPERIAYDRPFGFCFRTVNDRARRRGVAVVSLAPEKRRGDVAPSRRHPHTADRARVRVFQFDSWQTARCAKFGCLMKFKQGCTRKGLLAPRKRFKSVIPSRRNYVPVKREPEVKKKSPPNTLMDRWKHKWCGCSNRQHGNFSRRSITEVFFFFNFIIRITRLPAPQPPSTPPYRLNAKARSTIRSV